MPKTKRHQLLVFTAICNLLSFKHRRESIPALALCQVKNAFPPARERLVFVLLALLVLILTSPICLALPDDREKLLELSADKADLNQQVHRGEYSGNVQLDQGSSHLRAAHAVTEGDKQNKLVMAEANGDKQAPAHFWTLTAIDKPPLHAYADTIRYYPDRHLIELIGNARVTQGDNSFTAPMISYDTVKQHVVSKGDSKSRTTIIIHPGKKA